MKNLAEKGLLVNLKISHWSGKKNDKKVSSDIEQRHHATNAGRYNKNLLDDTELKEIHSLAASVRNYVKDNTLPWGDNNDRLLPAIHFLEFFNQFRGFKDQFEDAIRIFLLHYPSLIMDAQIRLGTLFRADDYPEPEKMKKKFHMDISCDAIAKLDDFRLQVDEQELGRLRQEMEQQMGDRISSATKDIWARIKDTVEHMVEKLSDNEARFHDTLVTNIKDLVELLPKLNITDDADINQVVSSMKSLVVDPDNLRDNSRFRSQKAKEAQAILDKFSSYMAA